MLVRVIIKTDRISLSNDSTVGERDDQKKPVTSIPSQVFDQVYRCLQALCLRLRQIIAIDIRVAMPIRIIVEGSGITAAS